MLFIFMMADTANSADRLKNEWRDQMSQLYSNDTVKVISISFAVILYAEHNETRMLLITET